MDHDLLTLLEVVAAADPTDPERKVKVRHRKTGMLLWLIPRDGGKQYTVRIIRDDNERRPMRTVS